VVLFYRLQAVATGEQKNPEENKIGCFHNVNIPASGPVFSKNHRIRICGYDHPAFSTFRLTGGMVKRGDKELMSGYNSTNYQDVMSSLKKDIHHETR
jgi:hypothetical protein